MRNAVVGKVAALAERGQIARTVVAGILVEVRCRQHDVGPRQRPKLEAGENSLLAYKPGRGGHAWRPTPAAIAPGPLPVVPPQAITSDRYPLAMRTPAMLASPLGPLEADQV